MSYAAALRRAYPFKPPSTSVDHIVIGGGVIGAAVAAGLVNTAGSSRSTFLVERREQETTARNSEVIHSGIYYPLGSLKSRLCIRGRQLLYDRCGTLDIAHRKTQKLIVATDKYQIPYLDSLQTLSCDESLQTSPSDNPYENNSSVPAYFLSGNEARGLEPDLSPDVCAALLVTETGIVDSQGLVSSLEREIEEEDYLGDNHQLGVGLAGRRKGERGEGVIVRGTRVVRIDPDEKGGWVVQMETGWEGKPEGEKGEVEAVRADVVVNAAGLGAASLVEAIVPERERVKMWLVKGNYMSYKGPGVGSISRLIYPCPGEGLDHLGTHLTLDLDGTVRFGPDVEPIGDESMSVSDPDHWQAHLAPSPHQLDSIAAAVRSYLPGVEVDGLAPDYAGFRPNIAPPGKGFDFLIRHKPERKGLVELFGFASPGLTSSLAVGEKVAALVRRDVWGKSGSVDKLAHGWEL
ncbi:hypothetical protein Q5752_002170 [Cryptotrichosporon argae]